MLYNIIHILLIQLRLKTSYHMEYTSSSTLSTCRYGKHLLYLSIVHLIITELIITSAFINTIKDLQHHFFFSQLLLAKKFHVCASAFCKTFLLLSAAVHDLNVETQCLIIYKWQSAEGVIKTIIWTWLLCSSRCVPAGRWPPPGSSSPSFVVTTHFGLCGFVAQVLRSQHCSLCHSCPHLHLEENRCVSVYLWKEAQLTGAKIICFFFLFTSVYPLHVATYRSLIQTQYTEEYVYVPMQSSSNCKA